MLWKTLFSRAIWNPVEDFAVWTQWSFLEVSYLVSINSIFSLSLSHLITSYPHLLPASGGSILTQNLKLLQRTKTWRKGWHPLPHAGDSVKTGALQKNLFLTTQVVLGYWTDSQEMEDVKPLYILQTHNVTYTPNHVNTTVIAAPHSSAWQAQNSEDLGQDLCLKNEVWVKSAVLVWGCQSLHVGHKKKHFKGNN